MPRVKEGSYALCVVALKPYILEVCFIHQKDREKNIFSDDITIITLLETSDLL